MAREKQHDYDDIPGTYVFDAERSRQGFGINMFCMSLMKVLYKMINKNQTKKIEGK